MSEKVVWSMSEHVHDVTRIHVEIIDLRASLMVNVGQRGDALSRNYKSFWPLELCFEYVSAEYVYFMCV